MTDSIKTSPIQRDSAEAQEQSAGIVPGTGKMGYGYDVTGPYCDPTSLRRPIVDLGTLDKQDKISGMLTSHLVNVTSATAAKGTETVGSSLQAYAKEFNSSLKVKGNNAFFAGELDASFSQSRASLVETSYVKSDLVQFYFKLTLDTQTVVKQNMTDKARDDFDNETPTKLVENYGTHYLSAIIVGGRASYCCTVNSDKYDQKTDLDLAARVSAETLSGKGSASADATVTASVSSLEKNSTKVVRALGGDPTLLSSIFSDGFDAWAKTVPNFLQFCDCTGGLTPISDLIDDPTRKDAVKKAIAEYLAGSPLPDDPDMVTVKAFHTDDPSRWCYIVDRSASPGGKWQEKTERGFVALQTPRDGAVQFYRMESKSGPKQFRLTSDPHKQHFAGNANTWINPVPVFYAYTSKPAGQSTRINAYQRKSKNLVDTSGWHYAAAADVDNWQNVPDDGFYVPKD